MSEGKSSAHIKAAYIGGVFAVIAACVGGMFLLANTLVEQRFVVIGPGVQAGTPVPSIDTPAPTDTPTSEPRPTKPVPEPTDTPTSKPTPKITNTPTPTDTPHPTPTPTPTPLFRESCQGGLEKWYVDGPWEFRDGICQIDITPPGTKWAAIFAKPDQDRQTWKNYSFEVDHKCETGEYSYFSFRETDQPSAYRFELEWESSQIRFGGKDNETLATKQWNLTYNRWYHIKIVVAGNQFEAYIDNKLALEATDPQNFFPYGTVALSVYGEKGQTRCSFDNVVVTAIVP